jgi:hypothetical protein
VPVPHDIPAEAELWDAFAKPRRPGQIGTLIVQARA